MIDINIQVDPTFITEVNEPRLEIAVQSALQHENYTADTSLSLVITDDAELQRLNLEFLGIDSPTDVLSFPANEIDPATGQHYLGDILISLPQARIQAEKAGHSLSAELELLVIHGVLHLLGYDHAEPLEKQSMWAAQAAILEAIGSPIKNVSE